MEKEKLEKELIELKKEKSKINTRIKRINEKLHRQNQREISDFERKTCEKICKESGVWYEEIL